MRRPSLTPGGLARVLPDVACPERLGENTISMVTGALVIVEADTESARSLLDLLARHGMRARAVASVAEALAEVDAHPFDVVLFAPEGERGTLPLSELVKSFDEIPVVVVGSGGAKRAVEAIRAGAADFVDKPFDEAELVYVLEKVLASAPEDEARPPPSPVPDSGLLGDSKAMHTVLGVVRRVAGSNATVLVRGESGTGKELVARAIHRESARAAGPFVKVHSAGLPETLLESELFGYEKGAFTGAASRKPGRVEIAQGGTLFLDEIGDITPAMQVKLLRLLQDKEYERLGGTATLRADVRFVAATHRDLEHMIKQGQFREDLFYRLNVVPIWLPPLRARRDDVALLARHFCNVFATAHGKPGTTLSDDAIVALMAERWSGNVRQLQNFMERLVVLAERPSIGKEEVRRELVPTVTFATQSPSGGGTSIGATNATRDGTPPVVPLDATLRDAEKRAIERALRHAKGNRSLAARLLGVGRTTLYIKLEELGIGRREP
jgi:two-component system response regulator AtoC